MRETVASNWSATGEACQRSNADCERCPVYLVHGLHKDKLGSKQCHQPESNAYLIEHGIPMPKREWIGARV